VVLEFGVWNGKKRLRLKGGWGRGLEYMK